MFDNLENPGMLDSMLTDWIIFKFEFKEAIENNLITEHQVWRRWLV
jgi:hypothetical protein